MPVVPEEFSRPTSVGAITYQALALKEQLKQLTPQEYPLPAIRIRNVLLSFVQYIYDELWKLYDKDSPLAARLDPSFKRTRALAQALQKVYSYMRFLRAASPHQCPPSIQKIVSRIACKHFPGDNILEEHIVTVVRPQWKYNLAFRDLNNLFEKIIAPSDLDRDDALHILASEQIVPKLWHWFRKSYSEQAEQLHFEENPPKHFAILSFAGLDTFDSLLYPLLIHELGHFFDYAKVPKLHQEITARHAIALEDIAAVYSSQDVQSPEIAAEQAWEILNRRFDIAVRELIADLIAARIVGFGFFAAKLELFKTLAQLDYTIALDSGYPGAKLRLSLVMDEINPSLARFLATSNDRTTSASAGALLAYINTVKNDLHWTRTVDLNVSASPDKEIRASLNQILEASILKALPSIKETVRSIIPDTNCGTLTQGFFQRIELLDRDLPPWLPGDRCQAFSEIFAAAWAYQFLFGENKEILKTAGEKQFKEYSKTCRLVLKAIEIEQTSLPLLASIKEPAAAEGAGVLCDGDLIERIKLPVSNLRSISIIPYTKDSVQGASLDLRLGNWFAFAKKTRLQSIDLGDPAQETLLLNVGREEVFVDDQVDAFLLHPGDLVLGATLEFVGLPNDVMAFVEGKSSLGRMGLIVATASAVAPGFRGVLVLELSNAGTVPLRLKPGSPIAQLVIHKLTAEAQAYEGRFTCQIKP